MAKGFIKSSERTFFDENGQMQVQTTQKEFKFKSEEDKFYMVFIDFVKWMYNITSVNSLKLLPKLMEIAEFDTGVVTISTGIRAQFMKELGLSQATFTRAINDLLENEAMQKMYLEETNEDTGEVTKTELKGQYVINPEMFWKGDLKKRKELSVIFKSK